MRSSADGSVRLQVSTRGKSEITAADIECPADVEIINPELHLLTLDSSDSELDIEFTVERGRGYSPAEEREKLPIGQIPVDAIFSPITKTSYSVQRTRVGQVTDYDRLVLEIWTDGTLRPAEALSASAQILVRHMTPIVGVSEVPAQEAAEQTEVSQPSVSRQVYDTQIESLELSVRAYNCLKRAGITRVGEILDKLAKGQSELLAIRNFGKKSFDELLTKLRDKGFLTDEDAMPEGQTATEQADPVQAATAADAAANDASEDTDGNDEDGAGQE
jgi:DNA-directed RNA polymerase subunit alpha